MENTLTVLLIEDEERDAQLFAIAVEEAHLDLHQERVSRGQEAVEYVLGTGSYRDRLQHPAPELIVLDLLLPATPGTGFLQWWRSSALCKHLPLVLLTGLPEADRTVQQALKQGVNRAYSKPTSIYDLIRIVREIHELDVGCRRVHAHAEEPPQ